MGSGIQRAWCLVGLAGALVAHSASASSERGSESASHRRGPAANRPAQATSTVFIDRHTRLQTIEGFGFFGAHDVWWGAPEDLVDLEWIRLVVDDLGLTLWRNEYFPPATESDPQDADWDKQRPFVEALRDAAAASHVPLEMLLTVWSAPATLKCSSDFEQIHDGVPHPEGSLWGGAVCPSKRDDFAGWLVEGLERYASIGVDVYGLSLQNEPLFAQPFGSGFYPRAAYAETLAEVGSLVHARFPDVKLFGPENLLEIEADAEGQVFDSFWYTQFLLDDPAARAELGAFALHRDGADVFPTTTTARRWSSFHDAVAPTGLPTWMTETSGYVDAWEGGANEAGDPRPGAFDLALAIGTALAYGQASAWLWWQGSALGEPNEYALMQGTSVGKRYHVCKHFFRFVRPGARMLAAASEDPELLALAFEHRRIGNFVTVLVNQGTTEKVIVLEGDALPRALDLYVTSEGVDLGPPRRVRRRGFRVPARSVATLVQGSFHDAPSCSSSPSSAVAGRRHQRPPH